MGTIIIIKTAIMRPPIKILIFHIFQNLFRQNNIFFYENDSKDDDISSVSEYATVLTFKSLIFGQIEIYTRITSISSV